MLSKPTVFWSNIFHLNPIWSTINNTLSIIGGAQFSTQTDLKFGNHQNKDQNSIFFRNYQEHLTNFSPKTFKLNNNNNNTICKHISIIQHTHKHNFKSAVTKPSPTFH